MGKPLPTHGFAWMTYEELDNWRDTSRILEVDLEYPDHLHNLHNDYSLAPESVKLKGSTLLKLIPNLNHKENYVLYYDNLKLCERLGLRITRIHHGIKFEDIAWLRKYIDLNTSLRMKARNSFEKDFSS